MNVKPARRRLVLVGKQPAEQALLAQWLVARQPLLKRGKRLGGVGLRGIGLDRAGGNQRLILCVERGGVGRQHGPLSASSVRKLQAVNWCWGYASSARHPREGGYPVRRGFSVYLRRLWYTGSSAGACHRATQRADPL